MWIFVLTYLSIIWYTCRYQKKVIKDEVNKYKEVILEYRVVEEMNEENEAEHREQRELLKTINQMCISHNMKYIPRNK